MASLIADIPHDAQNHSPSSSILTSVLFFALLLSYIPQNAHIFFRRPAGIILPLVALILYISGIGLLVNLGQAVCKNYKDGENDSVHGFFDFVELVVRILHLLLNWAGWFIGIPSFALAIYCALRYNKISSETTLLSQNIPHGSEGRSSHPVSPSVKTIVAVTLIHTLISIVWFVIFMVLPTDDNLDLVAFATWTCLIALFSMIMVFMSKFPHHYSPYTFKFVQNWVTPVLCVQASTYFTLAGCLAARFGVHHALSAKNTCSPRQSSWIGFLAAGGIYSMSTWLLYLIPMEERDAINKAEAEMLAVERKESEREAMQKAEDSTIALAIDDHTPLMKTEQDDAV